MKKQRSNLLKKVTAVLAAALMMVTGCVTALAAESTEVTVTIVGENGEIVMAAETISVTDADEDGALTINDALYLAHEAAYPGGAAAGFSSAMTEYGISLNLLWGIDNGGSYGYILNDAGALSLSDPIADGDYICAYAYTDLTTWSDVYSYFDVKNVTAKAGDELTLTLRYAGYDENWNPIVVDVAGAVITVDGEETDVVTDENGVAVIKVEKGEHVISAKSDSLTLVSPVCVATAEASGLSAVWYVVIAAAVVIIAAAAVVLGKKRKK
ncbi:MAG: hypothetical protein E7487_09560 [Ruminococcaceae bacterium]|nr:hypothetical protein [Oscillospiraceae bacterium]